MNDIFLVNNLHEITLSHKLNPILSEVAQIVKRTHKEEMRRRMSHGEILKLSDEMNHFPSGFGKGISTGQVERASNEYKTVMNGKEDYFKSNMMNRSHSSSSNTSR